MQTKIKYITTDICEYEVSVLTLSCHRHQCKSNKKQAFSCLLFHNNRFLQSFSFYLCGLTLALAGHFPYHVLAGGGSMRAPLTFRNKAAS